MAAAPKKASKTDLNDLLAAIGNSQPKKPTKSGVVNTESTDLDPKIDSWLDGRRMVKEGETKMSVAELSILPKAEKLRVEQSLRDGELHSSIKINEKITITAANRYSAVASENFALLKKEFGDRTGDYFLTQVDLSLTAEALADAEVIKKLLKTFGSDFTKYFNLKNSFKPTENFHRDRVLNAEVRGKADVLIAEGVIKPAKSSIKSAE